MTAKITEGGTPDVYKQLAELKLENHLLKERLDNMTRLATGYADARASICQQLEAQGLRLTIDDVVVRIRPERSEVERLRAEYGVFD